MNLVRRSLSEFCRRNTVTRARYNFSSEKIVQQQASQISTLRAFNQQSNNSSIRTSLPYWCFLPLFVCFGQHETSDKSFCRAKVQMETVNVDDDSDNDNEEDESNLIINWSGTHTVNVHPFHEPHSVEELQEIVRKCHSNEISVRPMGSALSPNGISFHDKGMVSLANLDRIIDIDTKNNTVTVEAGCRISDVIEALREKNLTLPNLASIAEQQMGGFVSIGAHGTGATIAPVDHYVTSLKLVTPARGTIELTPEKDGELFHLAKVGLGCLGVISEVTMQCIPAHNLLEHTFVLTRKQARKQLNELLHKHKHVRYMWIPYEDIVVVVTNDPVDKSNAHLAHNPTAESKSKEDERFQPMRDLILKLTLARSDPGSDKSQIIKNLEEDFKGKGFGELRDQLLAFDPLDYDHIKLVNNVEGQFWTQCNGYRIAPSDKMLNFDCGGQQWVFEVCFPTGTYDNNNTNDMQFMEDLLTQIENEKIPAHTPIEQRWSASSSSLMSPAYGPEDALHCWVGIIMYLPTDEHRHEISDVFKKEYCDLALSVGGQYNIVSHWGKLEMPTTGNNFLKLREVMEYRYPLKKFNAARMYFDPKNILGNNLIDTILGRPK